MEEMRGLNDYSHIPLGQQREAVCSRMVGGRGGCGERMGRQVEAELHRGDETATDGEHRQLVWWRGGSQWLEIALAKSTG